MLVAGALLSVTLAACGSSGSGGSGHPAGTLTFGVVAPFSGTDAEFGPTNLAGCIPGILAVEKAGGILGDKNLACKTTDTRGDPADAVPVVQQLATSTSNLVGVVGPTSDEATATVPILNQTGIPSFGNTGQIAFNQNHFKYFWRITPPDNDVGVAMAIYAHKKGYTRAAAVFGTDISSSGAVPTLLKSFKYLGGSMVVNKTIPLDQPSYQPEVAAIIAAHPQVIFTEADSQTSSTFFAELAQAHGLVPIIATDGTTEPAWINPVAKAMGKSNMQRYYLGATPYMAFSGPSFNAWSAALQLAANNSQMPKPIGQWRDSSFTATDYDDVIIMALAMEAAKSTNPSVYNSFIPKVTTASPNAVKVYSYAEGLKELQAGKQIQYIGATGAIAFDQYHNSPGGFEVVNSALNFVAAVQPPDITRVIVASGANKF
jgi:ABC-type branched-subunit amino acid transport system substrate-binding protein